MNEMSEIRKPSLFKRAVTAVARKLWSHICIEEMHLSPNEASMVMAYGGQFDDACWTANAIVRSKMDHWR